MTNTLHRFGSAASFDDDFIVFAMACKGPFKQENALEGLRRFLQIAIEYGPVNLGDARHGGAIRPSRQMNPFVHWSRDNRPDFQAVVDGLTDVGEWYVSEGEHDRAAREQFDGAAGLLRPVRGEPFERLAAYRHPGRAVEPGRHWGRFEWGRKA